MLIDIKRAVIENRKVYFDCYFDGQLWYKTEFNEKFSIPSEDMKGATFLAEDKAILFMRWMRKWNEHIEIDAFNKCVD